MIKHREKITKIIFTLSAGISILAVLLICFFLFLNGLPAIFKIGVFNFLLGKTWKPANNIFGLLPMIIGSFYVTGGAIILGVPIGILTAIFWLTSVPISYTVI